MFKLCLFCQTAGRVLGDWYDVIKSEVNVTLYCNLHDIDNGELTFCLFFKQNEFEYADSGSDVKKMQEQMVTSMKRHVLSHYIS